MIEVATYEIEDKEPKLKRWILRDEIFWECLRCARFCCKLGAPDQMPSKESGECVHLESTGNSYKCKIYDKRPLLCRMYPFVWKKVSRNRYTLLLMPICAGINSPKKGNKIDREFVEKNLAPHLKAVAAQYPQ